MIGQEQPLNPQNSFMFLYIKSDPLLLDQIQKLEPQELIKIAAKIRSNREKLDNRFLATHEKLDCNAITYKITRQGDLFLALQLENSAKQKQGEPEAISSRREKLFIAQATKEVKSIIKKAQILKERVVETESYIVTNLLTELKKQYNIIQNQYDQPYPQRNY